MKRAVVILLILSVICFGVAANLDWSLPKLNNSMPVPKKIRTQIVLQPLGTNFDPTFLLNIHRKMSQFVPGIRLGNPMNLPKHTYYAPRSRYRADSIIHWLSSLAKPGEIYLGITHVDISTTKNAYPDWGVMGLGYQPGNACVASSFRLKNKSSLWKVAIHELGHTTGLPHCSVKTCFMRDAEGGNPTNEETGFCSACRLHLLKAGWIL